MARHVPPRRPCRRIPTVMPPQPRGRRPRARPPAEFQSRRPVGERRPGLFPGSPQTRGASVSFGLPPAQLGAFISFSYLCSFCSFKRSLLFFRFVCSYSLRPFPPSPVTRFVRSPVAFLFVVFFVLHLFFSVLAQLADCLFLSFSPLSSVALFNFLFPLFGCCSRSLVFSPRISLLTSSPSLGSSPDGSAPALPAVCSAPDQSWRPAVRAGSGVPSRDEGPRGGSCPTPRALPGRVPVPGGSVGAARPPPLAGIRGARTTASH